MGMSPPMPLPQVSMSGLTPACSMHHILPVRPGARLHLVGHVQAAVLLAGRLDDLEELRRRSDVAALTLLALDDDRGHVVGGRVRRVEDVVHVLAALHVAVWDRSC